MLYDHDINLMKKMIKMTTDCEVGAIFTKDQGVISYVHILKNVQAPKNCLVNSITVKKL